MENFNWVQFIATCGTVLIGTLSLWFSYRFNKKTLLKKGLEDEQKEIYKKLNEFYGPLSLLRGKSARIYRVFSERFKKDDPDFKTLNYLMADGRDALTPDEQALLSQILDIGAKIEDLVIVKSGLIDDPELSHYLKRLLSHTTILKLAFDGVLTGDPAKYDQDTFPREIDDHIASKIADLQRRLEEIKKV
jgi:hypothetical protein